MQVPPESQHGYRFQDGEGGTSSDSEARLRLHLGSKPQVLPQPKPRAVREHFVVPSIRDRDGACAQRSRVGHREHSLKAFDVGNLFGSPFRPNIRHERGNRQGGAASACRDCENVLHRAGVSVS